jgi:hypothetical protein
VEVTACPKESKIMGGDKGEWLPFSESCFNSEELEGRWLINTDSEALFLEIKFEESIQSVEWYSVKLLNDQSELLAFGLLPFRKGVFKGVLSTTHARSIPIRFYKYNGRNPGEQFYKLIMKWPKEGHREKEFVPQKSSLLIKSSTH